MKLGKFTSREYLHFPSHTCSQDLAWNVYQDDFAVNGKDLTAPAMESFQIGIFVLVVMYSYESFY